MSKMYQKYLQLKLKSHKKLYLFECGNFYIFLDEDAKKINELFDLKITKFGNDIVKCGFPKNAFDKYINLFKTKKLKIDIISNENKNIIGSNIDNNGVIEFIKKVDLNSLTPLDAFDILKKLKGMVD